MNERMRNVLSMLSTNLSSASGPLHEVGLTQENASAIQRSLSGRSLASYPLLIATSLGYRVCIFSSHISTASAETETYLLGWVHISELARDYEGAFNMCGT